MKQRHGKPWTASEEYIIYTQFLEGKTDTQVSQCIERNEKAVRIRWRKLGLIDKMGRPVTELPEFRSTFSSKARIIDIEKKSSSFFLLDPAVEPDECYSPDQLLRQNLISKRLANRLKNINVVDVRQLLECPVRFLAKQPNWGRKTLTEWQCIRDKIRSERFAPQQDEKIDSDLQNIEPFILNSEDGAIFLLECLQKALPDIQQSTTRSFEVLKLRLGIHPEGDEPLLLLDIANIFGVSKERIRQLERKALRNLSVHLSNPKIASLKKIQISVRQAFTDKESVFENIINFCISHFNLKCQHQLSSLLCLSYGLYNDYDTAYKNVVKDARGLRIKYKKYIREKNRIINKSKRKLEKRKVNSKKWEVILDQVIWPDRVNVFNHPVEHFSGVERAISKSSISRTGKFNSVKCQKDIHYESHEEYLVYQILEHAPQILWYQEQPCKIPYFSKRKRHYYPDIACLEEDGRVIIIEVKPQYYMLRSSVLRKALAALDYLNSQGIGYAMIDKSGCSLKTISLMNYDRGLEARIIEVIENKGVFTVHDLCREDLNFNEKILPIILNNDLDYRGGIIYRLPSDLSYAALL